MAWDESDVRLVPLEWLKPHEEIKVKNMKKLLDTEAPGGTQEVPRRHQQAPKRQPGGSQICICVCICPKSVALTTCF